MSSEAPIENIPESKPEASEAPAAAAEAVVDSPPAEKENAEAKAAEPAEPAAADEKAAEAPEAAKAPEAQPEAKVPDVLKFHGWGVMTEGLDFVPVSYEPRPLGLYDVEIAISHCGVCASDIHTASGGWGKLLQKPQIVGHEIIGVVVARGSKAPHKIGERVGVGAHCWACQDKKSCTACDQKRDNLCSKRVFTYSSPYPDGAISQGGYAEKVRVHGDFAYSIPKELPSEFAAPLLCGGVTVFAPLMSHKIGSKHKVGIVGMGGLGHMAIQFAHKLKAQVWAIGSSKSKEADAKSLGAAGYIDINNAEEVAAAKQSFDFILCTANAKGMNWDLFFDFVKTCGTFCLLAAPEEPLKISTAAIVLRMVNFCGSIIGSRVEVQDMLKFAAKHKVRPVIEEFPMEKVNEAVQKVVENKIRYRAVLYNPKK